MTVCSSWRSGSAIWLTPIVAQCMLVTTCALSNQNFSLIAKCPWFPARDAPWLAAGAAGQAASAWQHHRPMQESCTGHGSAMHCYLQLPASELPQQTSCHCSSKMAQPMPGYLLSPGWLGSREESWLQAGCTLPAMAAAPSRHFAQGSFSCHIADV